MSILWLIPISGVLVIPLASWLQYQSEKEKAARSASDFTMTDDAFKGYDNPVWRVLMDAYTGLRKAGVSIRRPFVDGLIKEIEEGREVSASDALLALRLTRQDIPEGRYDLGFLDKAVSRLSELQ